MAQKSISTTARDAVHNFSHYAAIAESGAEVIINRRGKAALRLVLADQNPTEKGHGAAIEKALAIRSKKPFTGKFNRSEAYDR
jgi:antitoxin (DNA-binding transcriptional repressor) of toxin-antitoxin stability system